MVLMYFLSFLCNECLVLFRCARNHNIPFRFVFHALDETFEQNVKLRALSFITN